MKNKTPKKMPKKSTRNRTSVLWQIVRLPARIINTRIRLSIGLAAGVLTLVLLAQLFSVIPNPNRAKMEARKLQTETLALTGSALVNTRTSLDEFKRTLEHAVDRDDDLVSIGLRKPDDQLAIELGEHAGNWEMPQNGRSNDRFMFVPIFQGQKEVAQLELRYRPLVSVETWFRSHTAKMAGFMLIGSFILFNLILYRTLRQLDPRGAVPRRVREALDNMAEGLVIVERTGGIMLANSKFASLVGIEAEELVGTNCSDFDWRTEEEDTELPWEKVVRTKTTVSTPLQITAEEADRTFSVSAAPILGARGSCRGVMITFDDITTLEEHKRDLIKARKAADEANEAKSNFLSRMSHEIRTPMNAIIGYTDILRQGAVSPPEQQQYLSTIHSSGDHLLTIINDILDLSKIEAGQMTVEHRDFELIPLCNQIIRTLKIKANEKNLALDFVIEGSIPATIRSDETRLQQVLINTIGNAIKFTHEGGVTMIARMPQPSTNGLLEIDVADTGIGMPESALKNIFNPFSQADDSVTRKFGGTGLGLSISKQLSEAMGGGISVRSKEGVGTVFTISINPGEIMDDTKWVCNDDLKTDTIEPQKPANVAKRFDNGHILVVDDTQANRDLAGLMLKRLGLTCDYAENGQVSLDRIAENHYDLVLMDMSMPVMDGLTATGKIREQGLTVPVIALTAMATDEERIRCMEGGCDSFLPKPIRMDGLINILSQYLEGATGDMPESEGNATGDPVEEVTSVVGQVVSESCDAPTPEDKTAEIDDLDSSLLETLASLGMDDCDLTESTDNSAVTQLVLPDVVRSSLPLDEDILPIVNGFAERLGDRLEEFSVAKEAGDITKLNELGHWLAGSAATVGFDEFVAASRELEYCDGSDQQRVEQLIEFILELAKRVEVTAVSN